MGINKASIRQAAKDWGWRAGSEAIPRQHAEKALGAAAGGQRLPTDSFWSVLSRHTARGLGAQLHFHTKTHSRPLPEAGGPSLPQPPHTEGRGLLALIPLSSQSRRQGVQPSRWSNRSPTRSCGNSAFLIDSILSLERALGGRSHFLPQAEGGERIQFCREETGQEVVQIFLETWEFSTQGPSRARNDWFNPNSERPSGWCESRCLGGRAG